MKYRLLPWLLLLIGVVSPYLFSSPPSSFDSASPITPTPLGGGDLFAPVFAIMDGVQGPDAMGCRGCHIGPKPGYGPWFGDDKATVLQTLETGMTPDGMTIQPPVQGGRYGTMGSFLHSGIMPLGGTPWDDDQLTILDKWLITYED
jgi:hypothetical protein